MYCKLNVWKLWCIVGVDFATGVILSIHVCFAPTALSGHAAYIKMLLFNNGYSPNLLRLDDGGENVVFLQHHISRRGDDSFTIGSSHHNIAVERTHRETFEKVSWAVRDELSALEHAQLLDSTNQIHLISVARIYGPHWQLKLNEFQHTHNNRTRRAQPKRGKPKGVPIEEYRSYFPSEDIDGTFDKCKDSHWRLNTDNYTANRHAVIEHRSRYGSHSITDCFGAFLTSYMDDHNMDSAHPVESMMQQGVYHPLEVLTEAGVNLRERLFANAFRQMCPTLVNDITNRQKAFVLHRLLTEYLLVLNGRPEFDSSGTDRCTTDMRNVVQQIVQNALN